MSTIATADTDMAVRAIRQALAHAEKRAAEKVGQDDWLYWRGEIDAFQMALTVLDAS